VIKTKSY